MTTKADRPLPVLSSDGLGPLVDAAKEAARHYAAAVMTRDDSSCNATYAALESAILAVATGERERWAKECAGMASLSWAAADQPYAPEVKMQHEAVAAAFEQMAADMRA